MRKPEFITFTGADEGSRPDRLLALATDYPVEYAILFSDSRPGCRQYPSVEWADQVQTTVGLRLAAHLGGTYADEVIATGHSRIDHRLHGVARVQVNTGGPVDPSVIRHWADGLSDRFSHPIDPILQCRGPFPGDNRVSWLYDCSGGTGLLPTSWPIPSPNVGMVGYAGGLGPATVAEVLPHLPQDTPYWLDMKTRVRNADDQFDIGLCRQVCEIVYGATIGN